jgi:threonine dehydratase
VPAAEVTFDDVLAARERIRGLVHRTPVLRSTTLDAELGAEVHFKAENLQRIGAFKARGAVNAVFSLTDAEAARGVVTHSSGNHAAACAYAARQRSIACTVVMPRSAPAVKVDAVRGYGATIEFCEQSEREQVCAALQARTGATLLHPFADARVIAGQGTAVLELIEDVAEPLDIVITPVGGGGLAAGTAVALGGEPTAIRPRLVLAEPLAVDDAARSLRSGVRQPAVEQPRTWADGLLTALGEPNFAILQAHGAKVVTVDEDAMLAAARFFLQRMKTVVEPSAATVLAAMRSMGEQVRGLRVGAVLSGGNTDFAWLSTQP